MWRWNFTTILFLVGVCVSAPAGASPFTLVVPRAVTIDTNRATGAGFSSIFINGDEAVTLPTIPATAGTRGAIVAYGLAPGEFYSTSDFTAANILLFTSGYMLAANTTYIDEDTGRTPAAIMNLVSGNEFLAAQSGTGMQFGNAFNWNSGHVGSTTFETVFGIGDHVARYLTAVTFVAGSGADNTRFTVSEAQVVHAILQPGWAENPIPRPVGVPEPSTLLFLAIGALTWARTSHRR